MEMVAGSVEQHIRKERSKTDRKSHRHRLSITVGSSVEAVSPGDIQRRQSLFFFSCVQRSIARYTFFALLNLPPLFLSLTIYHVAHRLTPFSSVGHATFG